MAGPSPAAALKAMHAARVGSMVVVDAGQVPIGIFTTVQIAGEIRQVARSAAKAAWSRPFATDQDNALMFVPEGDLEQARRAFLELAGEVNQELDACGFPLCKGDVMARNPRWPGAAQRQHLFRFPRAAGRCAPPISFDVHQSTFAGTLPC